MFQPSTLFHNCLHILLLWSSYLINTWHIYTYVWLNTCVWLNTDKCGKPISGELTLSTLQGAGYNFRMGEVKKIVHLFAIINFSFFSQGRVSSSMPRFTKEPRTILGRQVQGQVELSEHITYSFIYLFQINPLEHHLHQNWEWYWIQKEGWLNFVFSVSCRQRRSPVVQVKKKDDRNAWNEKRISQKVS